MCGIQAANPKEKDIAKLAAATIDCAVGRNQPKDMDAILNRYCVNDIDPTTQILVHRLMAIRRSVAKRPANEATLMHMFDKYNLEADTESDTESDNEDDQPLAHREVTYGRQKLPTDQHHT